MQTLLLEPGTLHLQIALFYWEQKLNFARGTYLMKKHIVKIFLLIISFLSIIGLNLNPATAAEAISYVSPEGIIFTSSASGWSNSDLIDLYQNFITNNQHGEELKSLRRITVVAGNGCPASSDSDLGVGGCYLSNGEIILNGGENWNDGKEINPVLSHEYGHHFSYYWIKDYAKWSKLRGLDYYPVNSAIHYDSSGHHWSILEIMADDYATLYGDKRFRINEANKDNGDVPRFTLNENNIVPDPTQLPELNTYLQTLTGLVPNGQITSGKIPQLVSFQPENHEDGLYYRIEFTSATTDVNKTITYFISVGRFADKVTHTGTENIIHLFKESIPISEGISYLRPASYQNDSVKFIAYDSSSTQYIKSSDYYYNFTSHDNPFPVPFSKKIALERYGISTRSVNWDKIIGVQVFINNVQVYFPNSPVILNDSTLVPMRSCFEFLGADVKWDPTTRTAIATKGGSSLQIKASQFITIEGSLFVPLRFISEFFGMEVMWDSQSKTVYISQK